MPGETLVRGGAEGLQEVEVNRPYRLLQILTLRCEAASELLSRELDESLPGLERAALAGHLLVCRSCRLFRRQLRQLTASIRQLDRDPAQATARSNDSALSPEARQRIARSMSLSTGTDSTESTS